MGGLKIKMQGNFTRRITMTKKKPAAKAKAPAKKAAPAKKSASAKPAAASGADKPPVSPPEKDSSIPTAETGPAKKLSKAQVKAEGGTDEQKAIHEQLEDAFKTVKDILTATAEDPNKHPRQLRWALKAVDAAHVAAKSHVDRNV